MHSWALGAIAYGKCGHHLQISFCGCCPNSKTCDLQVPFGDKVSIVGSIPELGSWEADLAPGLHWSNADVWTTHLDLPSG